MKIGIAGTGKMGSAIARRLLKQGHEVHVWNRSPASAEVLVTEGAQRAATARDLANAVETTITILTDAAAMDAVYAGPDGLFAANVSGKLMIDMSTVRPHSAEALGVKVKAAGAAFVECPVGGTVGPALEGKLLGFAGGAEADVARARPLLDQLCRRLEHVGPVGAGASVKLAINLPLMVYWQAFGESMSLVQHLGLDPARMIEILSETTGGPNLLRSRGKVMAGALSGGDSGPVTVQLNIMAKDVRTMVEEAASKGCTVPATSAALGALERAIAGGNGAIDCTHLPVWWLREGGKAA